MARLRAKHGIGDAIRRSDGDRDAHAPVPGRRDASAARAGLPVQRMVIYGGNVARMDSVIAADVSVQHDAAPGEMVTIPDLLDPRERRFCIAPGERVVITGHGVPGAVEGHPAAVVASALKTIANIERAGSILFTTCNAAVDVNNVPGTSVVAVTHQALGGKVEVAGAPGPLVNDYARVTGGDVAYCPAERTKDVATIQWLLMDHLRMQHLKEPRNFDSMEDARRHGLGQRHPSADVVRFTEQLLRILTGTARKDTIEAILIAGGGEQARLEASTRAREAAIREGKGDVGAFDRDYLRSVSLRVGLNALRQMVPPLARAAELVVLRPTTSPET